MTRSDDLVVERCAEGWAISCGRRRLKRFRDTVDRSSLRVACEWAAARAEEERVTAWLRHGTQRSRIGPSDE